MLEVAAKNVLTIPCTRATRPNLTTTQEAADNTDNTNTDTTECHPSSQKRPRLQQMEEDSAQISNWPHSSSPEARQPFQPITPAKSGRTLAVVDMTELLVGLMCCQGNHDIKDSTHTVSLLEDSVLK